MLRTLNSSFSPKHKTAVIFQERPVRKLTTACAAGPKLSIGDQWAALPAASSEQGSTQSFEFHLGKARLPLQMARHALLLEDDQGHQSPQA